MNSHCKPHQHIHTLTVLSRGAARAAHGQHAARAARRAPPRRQLMARAGKGWLTVGIVAVAAGLTINRFASTMPTFAQLRLKHEAVSLIGKEAVVVGGTSGIGMGIAVRLAEAGAAVTIVGRNQDRAAQIIEQMKSAAPEGTAPQYVLSCMTSLPTCSVDVTLRDCQSCAQTRS